MEPVTMITTAMGLGKAAFGAIQELQSRKLQRRNPRPDYEIAKEYFENEAMLEAAAQTGMGQDALTWQNNQSLRGLTASLAAGLQLGINPNQATDYYSTYLQQMGQTAVQDVQLRMQKINTLAAARQELANQRFIEFGYDKDAPYKDTARAAAELGAQGVGNIFGGLDTLAGGLVAERTRQLYADRTKALSTPAATVPQVDRGVTVPGVGGTTTAPDYTPSFGTSGGKFANPYKQQQMEAVRASLTGKTPPTATQEQLERDIVQDIIRRNKVFKKVL